MQEGCRRKIVSLLASDFDPGCNRGRETRTFVTTSQFPGSLTPRDRDGGGEGVERVAEEGVVRRNEAPLVLSDVVDFARHVVVAADHVDFVLEEEGLVRDAKLVHRVERPPGFRLHVEQVHFTIAIGVLASDQNYICRRDGQSRARPKRILKIEIDSLIKEGPILHLPSCAR